MTSHQWNPSRAVGITYEQIEKAVAITVFRICNGEMDEKTRKRPDLEWAKNASLIPEHLLNVGWEEVQLAWFCCSVFDGPEIG